MALIGTITSKNAKPKQVASAIQPTLFQALAGTIGQQAQQVAEAQPSAQKSSTPYLDVAKAYEQRARENLATQEAAMQNQLSASKNSTNASYDTAAAGNYINYMKQQNSLPEQLARQGINGGASESALTRVANNYALNQGNTTASRLAALGQLDSAYNTNLANLRQAAEENIMNNNLSLQQAQIAYEDTLAQRAAEEARYREEVQRAAQERAEDLALQREQTAYERQTAEQQYKDAQKSKMVEQYAAGLAKYTSVDTLEKMAKNIKKDKNWSKDPTKYGKVQAINARIGEIKAANKK